MRFISWNVNGFRAVLEKGFGDFFDFVNADIFAIQESKMQEGQASFDREGYRMYASYAEKKGYSGTMIFTKKEPLSVTYGIDGVYNDEGRLIALEFEDFWFLNSYTPNAQKELARLDYRMKYEDDLREYMKRLDEVKPVVLCGDLNVAREEIDLKNPKTNVGNAGFSNEERAKARELLAAGFTDTFRHFYPDKTGAYTWWSYMFKAREKNTGWRIDYFIVSNRFVPRLTDAVIYPDIMGSDHCPVGIELN